MACDRTRRGLSLIELLLVVAVLAILAAIALPSLTDAQVRSMVARTKADFASLRTVIESYHVDHAEYPRMTMLGDDTYTHPDGRVESMGGTLGPWVTTPVAYTTYYEWPDPFTYPVRSLPFDLRIYTYHRTADVLPLAMAEGVLLESVYGPRTHRHYMLWSFGPSVFLTGREGLDFELEYDPTNGTISVGGLHLRDGVQ